MEKIYFYTATTKVGYSWYGYDPNTKLCTIEDEPNEWDAIRHHLPPGGHLPGLAITCATSTGISLCISGIKSHRLEKNTGQIVDTIFISNSTGKLSDAQMILIYKFLEGTPINIDVDNPFIGSTYSEWFTGLSECITNKGDGGVLGIDFDSDKFNKIISESSILVQNSQTDTSNLEEDTESDIALDTFENRDFILKNLNKYAYNNNFPISLLLTYGINPKELEGKIYKGLTVHRKAKIDLSDREDSKRNVTKQIIIPDGDIAGAKMTEQFNADNESDDTDSNAKDVPNAKATQIEIDTNKIAGIIVTSAGIVISLFYGKVTIMTSLITGTGVYLFSKRKKPK